MLAYDNPDRKRICGINIARLIQQSDIIRSQEHFAELMGVDCRTVRRWLKEGVDRLSTVKAIADLLGISDMEILFSKKERGI